MNAAIEIKSAVRQVDNCESVIVVPLRAVQEAGYIKTLTVKDSGHAKHEYHAMAQMAYFQFQDDELEVEEIPGPVVLSFRGEESIAADGLILYRDDKGELHTLVIDEPNQKKLLEAAYRYCTRWVRLDI